MWILLVAGAAFAATPGADPVAKDQPDALSTVLASELTRAWAVLRAQPEPPYYAAVSVEDEERLNLSARSGTLDSRDTSHSRLLDVDLRVGSVELDSTRPLRGTWSSDSRGGVSFPLDAEPDFSLRHALWRELDARYREAAQAIGLVRANQNVRAAEEDPAPDFSRRDPVVFTEGVQAPELDRAAWEAVLVDLSNRLDRPAFVEDSAAQLTLSTTRNTFLDTEGSRIAQGNNHLRVSMWARATAPDGDQLQLYRYQDVHDPGHLPDAATLQGWADALVLDLENLLAAPRGEPYSGPVILRGRAAGVFFHEVLGHRVEGHRQKEDEEGKTFTDKVGQRVLPAFLDVYDDPSIERLAGQDLNGFYRYDDEGVPGQKAVIVDDGVFRGFLLGRSPIAGFPDSNGHGRRSSGNWPSPRMGNLIIESDQPVPVAELRAKLIAELKTQKLPYGLLVDEIAGGFTLTGRTMPNAFNVLAIRSWRVYADGRPDELLRGVDLVGTPLTAFQNLIATGDDPGVFNGVCGAESGWVPVSAVSPSVLFRTLEIQRKEKAEDKPPLLPKPASDRDGAVDAGGGR